MLDDLFDIFFFQAFRVRDHSYEDVGILKFLEEINHIILIEKRLAPAKQMHIYYAQTADIPDKFIYACPVAEEISPRISG
jgi:hypothetical protein